MNLWNLLKIPKQLLQWYKKFIFAAYFEEEFPLEAQYVVPMAYQLRWSLKINLRSLMWLVELRTTPQGHENYRWLAQQMFQRVQEVQPRLAQLMRFVNLEDYPLGRLAPEVKQELRKQSS